MKGKERQSSSRRNRRITVLSAFSSCSSENEENVCMYCRWVLYGGHLNKQRRYDSMIMSWLPLPELSGLRFSTSTERTHSDVTAIASSSSWNSIKNGNVSNSERWRHLGRTIRWPDYKWFSSPPRTRPRFSSFLWSLWSRSLPPESSFPNRYGCQSWKRRMDSVFSRLLCSGGWLWLRRDHGLWEASSMRSLPVSSFDASTFETFTGDRSSHI